MPPEALLTGRCLISQNELHFYVRGLFKNIYYSVSYGSRCWISGHIPMIPDCQTGFTRLISGLTPRMQRRKLLLP